MKLTLQPRYFEVQYKLVNDKVLWLKFRKPTYEEYVEITSISTTEDVAELNKYLMLKVLPSLIVDWNIEKPEGGKWEINDDTVKAFFLEAMSLKLADGQSVMTALINDLQKVLSGENF